MASLTTIQVTQEEDREISQLKEVLGLSSKKAVVMEGVHLLEKMLVDRERVGKLKKASLKVRKSSLKANREWSASSSAIHKL